MRRINEYSLYFQTTYVCTYILVCVDVVGFVMVGLFLCSSEKERRGGNEEQGAA